MGRIPYYDVTLLAAAGGQMVIDHGGREVTLPCAGALEAAPLLGRRGAVEAVEDKGPTVYRFHVYQDQSLRRAPELDAYPGAEPFEWDSMRIGWRCDSAPEGFDAPGALVPGINGAFVEDHSSAVSVAVPVEFEDLCAQLSMTPLQVLRSFMANACALADNAANPRVDGLICTSPAAVQAAASYIAEAHGHANT